MSLYNYIGGVNAKVLPVPMMNIINGGLMLTTVLIFKSYDYACWRKSFKEAFQNCAEVFHNLKSSSIQRLTQPLVMKADLFKPKE